MRGHGPGCLELFGMDYAKGGPGVTRVVKAEGTRSSFNTYFLEAK